MERIAIETTVQASPEEAYEFLRAFPDFVEYTRHLAAVRPLSNGDEPSRYEVTGRYRGFRHTVRSKVTAEDRPTAFEWELEGRVRASGRWECTPRDDGSTTVRTVISYDLASVGAVGRGLVPLLSISGLRDRINQAVEAEVNRVLQAMVDGLDAGSRAAEAESRPD